MMTASLGNKAMRLYINGSLAGETILKDFERAEFLFRSDNKIGTSGDYRPTYAQLDDIRIYNRALSAEEIKALYDLEKPIAKETNNLQPSKLTTNSLRAKAAIEAEIRKRANKPTGQLTKADLEKVTRLELENKEITDLTPLASLVNLDILLLGKNQITDLTPLVSLEKLTQLDVNDNQISDLSPLLNLTDLKFLWLRDNPQLTRVQVLKLNHTIEQKQKDMGFPTTLIVYTNSK